MFMHKSWERHGIRWWLHFRERSCFKVEFYWLSPRFGISVGTDDDGWNFAVRVPPLALCLSFDGFGLWQPHKTCIATWDNNREFTIPDRREFDFYISDWRVQFTPWGKWGEWVAADPWWIRGVSVDLTRLVFGPWQGSHADVGQVNVTIPMPEGDYRGVVTIQHWTRGHRRWFKRHTTEAWLDIPKGIPHAGKGENSWDCGDDGLFGIGGDSVEDAIRRAQESVMRDRKRYGNASVVAIREALHG